MLGDAGQRQLWGDERGGGDNSCWRCQEGISPCPSLGALILLQSHSNHGQMGENHSTGTAALRDPSLRRGKGCTWRASTQGMAFWGAIPPSEASPPLLCILQLPDNNRNILHSFKDAIK